jgi:DNA mismatch repair ATPase MutL
LLHGIEDGDVPMERERERLAELMAKRGSAGYGKGVASVDALELLHRLEKCANPSFTNSGTPIMVELTVDEVRAKLTKF